MTPKTIDIATGAVLFADTDPVGLLPDASARSYLEELRRRIGELYPKATVFLRWSPTSTDAADVFTIPRAEAAATLIGALARELQKETEAWVCYDESVRATFAA